MKSKLIQAFNKLDQVKFSTVKKELNTVLSFLHESQNQRLPFFLQKEKSYSDKASPLPFLIISELDAKWKDYIRTNTKSTIKGTLRGNCSISNHVLTFYVTGGKGKQQVLKDKLIQSKILPSFVHKVKFTTENIEKANPSLEAPTKEKATQFTNIKSNQLALEQQLKKKPNDSNIRQKLDALKEQRTAVTQQLFNAWKKQKGWEDKSPREILTMYGDNWFTFKDELAYLEKNQQQEAYEVKLAALEMVLKYRKVTVDTLLQETIKKVASDCNLSEKDINAVALGSITPTSDYDITFEMPQHPYWEYKCVQYFNDTFQSRHGVTSGILFDTNVYTSGFMPFEASDKALVYKDKVNPTGSFYDLKGAEKQVIKKGKKVKHQVQLALSIVSIRQALNSRQWENFKLKTLTDVINTLSQQLPVSDPTHKKELLDIAKTDLAQILKRTEGLHQETKNAIQEKIGSSASKLSSEHKEAQSKDALYVEELEKTAHSLALLNSNTEAFKQTTDPAKRQQLLAIRSKLIVDFEQAQGKALIYANEAYFSAGAAVHVVKGMQGGSGIKIGRQQKMQSILMNLGYKLQHFQEQANEHGLGRALISTSKYGQRMGNLVLDEDNKILQGEKPENQHIERLMKLDEELIKGFKKNDVTYPTPSAKESAAEEHISQAFHNSSVKGFMTMFLAAGVKSFAPFYIDKYKSNLARAKKQGEDVSSVSFW